MRVVHNAEPVEKFLQKDGGSKQSFQRYVVLPGNKNVVIVVMKELFIDGSHYPVTGQTTVGDALENALKRIGLGSEWSAALQLFYRDHDGVLCRFTKPEVIPNQNEIFLRLFLLSPELLQILIEDKSFRKVQLLAMNS